MKTKLIYNKFKTVLLVAVFLQIQSEAVPMAYNNKFTSLKDLVNPTRSDILGDSSNPNLVYVMPPKSGAVDMTDFTANANIGKCKELTDLNQYSAEQAKYLNDMSAKRNKLLEELTLATDKFQKAYQESEQYKFGSEEVKNYSNLEDKVELTQIEIDKLNKEYFNIDCSEKPKACVEMRAQLSDLKSMKKTYESEMQKIRAEHYSEIKKYKVFRANVIAAEETFNSVNSKYKSIIENISSTHDLIKNLYSEMAKYEGGTANLYYNSHWEENVLALRQQNPGYQFQKLPAKNAKIFANFIGATSEASYKSSLPAVLDYSVGGFPHNPWTEREDVLASLPDDLSASVRLSLIGACAHARPDLFTDIVKSSTGSPKYGLTIMYEYPAAFRVGVKAKFNMHKVYELIKKSTTSGGFFWTSTVNEVSERKEGWEHLSIEWLNEDEENALSIEEKTRVETEIKKEIMAEVVYLTAVPDPGAVHAPAQLPPPESGASYVGGVLLDTCGGVNVYCAVGGFVLKGLSSIFGGSEAESRFYQTTKAVVEREYSTTEAHTRTGVLVYSQK